MSIANPTDAELRELLNLYGVEKPTPLMPQIEPIRLTDIQLTKSLEQVGVLPDDSSRKRVQRELTEAAEYFLSEYYFQAIAAPSVTERKLKAIQAAARKLILALGPWDRFPQTIESAVQSYLRIAAEEYGARVGLPAGVDPREVYWNFWPVYKLPSAVSGLRLIEHWGALAQANLRAQVKQSKREGTAGNRGKTAVRVLIHRLVLVWWNATGHFPGVGVNAATEKADGPFIRFAADFLDAMKQSLTDTQRAHHVGVETALSISPDAIRDHTRLLKANRVGSSPAKAKGKSVRRRH